MKTNSISESIYVESISSRINVHIFFGQDRAQKIKLLYACMLARLEKGEILLSFFALFSFSHPTELHLATNLSCQQRSNTIDNLQFKLKNRKGVFLPNINTDTCCTCQLYIYTDLGIYTNRSK